MPLVVIILCRPVIAGVVVVPDCPEMDGVVVVPDCPDGFVFEVDVDLVVGATPKMVAVTA